MKKSKLIFLGLLLVSVCYLPSCRDKPTEPEWNPSGLYNIAVQVTGRPPAIMETDSSNIDYDHVTLFNQIFDTTVNKCCHWRFSTHTCPPTYEIFNIRIFESNGIYFLYNGIDSSGDRQISYHIPLIKSENKLTLDPSLSYEKNAFHLLTTSSIMSSSAEQWPTWFHLLNFEMTQNDQSGITGKWALFDDYEYCTTVVSTGATKNFALSEFANLTFEKIGD